MAYRPNAGGLCAMPESQIHGILPSTWTYECRCRCWNGMRPPEKLNLRCSHLPIRSSNHFYCTEWSLHESRRSYIVGHCLQGHHTVRMPSTLPFLAKCRTWCSMNLVRLSTSLPVSLQLNLFSKMYHVVQLECRRSGGDLSQGIIYYKCSACYTQHVEHIF